MRFILPCLAVLLIRAIFTPSVRAQDIPYRRTIPYLSYRPYQYTGRYVRLSVATGGFGRSMPSLTIQATISYPVGGITLSGRNASASDANNDRQRGGGGR
jgi:hypothetical protein